MSEFSDYMDATLGSTPVAAKASESELWTPTTNQVRDGYRYDPEAEYRDPITPHHEINGRAFDRWLAEVKAEAAAEALRGAAEKMPFGYTHAGHILRALADEYDTHTP